jgi:cell division protein FtsB
MIDGSDKLLMEHRNRQVDALAKRITELEAEIAALRTGGTPSASHNSAMIEMPPSCKLCLFEDQCTFFYRDVSCLNQLRAALRQ